ncbi:MAG: aminoglycoside phosphotransferase family protein [Lachnospiraceae bacterium]|nr:aminoglycoside phosphotransferase family protein [Lachnospiraceae bacterium]
MTKLDEEIYTLLNEQVKIKELHYLSSGDDSDTFLCNGQYVVKVPKRSGVRITQRREFDLYRFFEDCNLSYKTPRVVYQSEYFNIMTYIKGEHITYKQYQKLNEKEKDALAYDEAAFLKELHSIEIDFSKGLFSEVCENKKDKYLKDKELLICILKKEQLLTAYILEHIEKIYANILNNTALFAYAPRLVHNDFSAGNMIFRNNRLLGVIDFGDFCISDPDNDFLCLLDNSEDDFGKDFGRRVLRYYQHPNPEEAERKAELNDAYWAIEQIIYGHERGDKNMLMKGVSELMQKQTEEFVF